MPPPPPGETALPQAWEGLPAAEDDAWVNPDEALQGTLEGVLRQGAGPAIASYRESMVTASPECPGVTATEGFERWFEHCRTVGGTLFLGYGKVHGYLHRGEKAQDEEVYWSGALYYLAATIDESSGRRFQAGGTLLAEQGSGRRHGEPFLAWHTEAVGTFRWNGPAAAGTWVAEPDSPNLDILARRFQGGERSVAVSGSVPVDDAWLTGVQFDTLQVALTGGDCHVDGTAWLRGPGAEWYRADYLGRGADCRACADVLRGEERAGRSCLDFLPLLDWEDAPW